MKEQLTHSLLVGLVLFKYRKQNGDLKTTIGTNKPELIPTLSKSKIEKINSILSNAYSLIHVSTSEDGVNTELLSEAKVEILRVLDIFEPKKTTEKIESEYITYYDLIEQDFRKCKDIVGNIIPIEPSIWHKFKN